LSDYIQDGTGTGLRAKVNSSNRLTVDSIETTAESLASSSGDSFNVSNDIVNITSDVETALIHIKNTNSEDWVITRVYFHFGGSTGGVGSGEFCMIQNATTGTLISGGTAAVPVNANFGSAKLLVGQFLQGTNGSTITDGTEFVRTIVPNFTSRNIIPFDSVVIPPGASLSLQFKPPTGNTSLKVQLGVNFFRREI
tara:strand:- start:1387 stop:1974 length:588 start_codon:yes stop_codon:yes gene_type:complete